jgi:N-acetylglucosaminyldiphosphoundecaprenol N-acetyl-beta-D-mannosaminyltransferase
MGKEIMNKNELQFYDFLGIRVHALTKAKLLEAIEFAVASSTPNNIIGNHNLHSLYLFHDNPHMRQFYDRNLCTHVDGMSLIFLARFFGVLLKRHHRTAYLDWFEDLLRMAEKRSWRIYFLGGKPEVANRVPEHFRAVYPRLQIRSHHGYDAFSQQTTVYKEIKEFAPNVLLVGMGMPLQEQWILESIKKLRVNLIMPCGAIMDYYLGAQKPAPRWIGQIGLEWLYRLLCEPRRLFFRYVIEPVRLMPLFFHKWQKG